MADHRIFFRVILRCLLPMTKSYRVLLGTLTRQVSKHFFSLILQVEVQVFLTKLALLISLSDNLF